MAQLHSATNGAPISEVPHAASVDWSGRGLPGAAARRRVCGARELCLPGPFAPERSGHAHRAPARSEEHTSELQSHSDLVCRLLLEIEKNNLFNNLIQRNQSASFTSGKIRPNPETNINIIARRTRKDVNSHTVLDGIITTIMVTIQRINIICSREGSRNRRRLKANQTDKKFRVCIIINLSPRTTHLPNTIVFCFFLKRTQPTTIPTLTPQAVFRF